MKTLLTSIRNFIGRQSSPVAPVSLVHIPLDPEQRAWPLMPLAMQPIRDRKGEGMPPWLPQGPREKWRRNWYSE